MAASFSTMAYTPSQPSGPFESVPELTAAWKEYAPHTKSSVAVDGAQVYSQPGFGPVAVGSYFLCPQDAMIRTNCPVEGPFINPEAIADFWQQSSPSRAKTIYVDGVVILNTGGFGPRAVFSYNYCATRPGQGYMTDCSL
jgi:hypothetical protein